MCHKHEQPALAAGAEGGGGKVQAKEREGEGCCKPRGVEGAGRVVWGSAKCSWPCIDFHFVALFGF